MKMIFIIIVSLFCNISINAQEVNNKNAPCPEQKISDLVYINYFLSDPKFDTKKEKLGIVTNRAKLTEFGTKDLNGLKSYLEEKGVIPITTNSTCQHITNILNERKQNSSYKTNFRVSFFSLDNSYLIIFIPLKKNQRERKGGWPILVLDNNFKIIDEFKLQ